nr:cysteine-rich receptor-like protein kinase 25 [Ipomoea batatas]GMD86344.1 cysteine-rich receptor-like protein kinase 25 [Ipomoea batatas]
MAMIWFWLLISLAGITKGSSFLSLRYNCQNETSYYTPNSTYKANLDSLLSNLYSNATRDNGFYHTTVGDTVHGLFLCRGDLSPYVCRNCIGDARDEILELCTNGKTALIWFDNCMLRYSQKSLFGILDTSTYFITSNKGNNDTQPNGFVQLVQNMMDQLIAPALSSGSDKKFAVLETNFSAFETVYALGQCTPDLSNDDCQICLTNAISLLSLHCFGAFGARVVFPSCNVRYEVFPFYNLSALGTPAPTILPNSESTKGNKGKSSAKVIIATSAVSVIGTLLFVLCFYFLKMKRVKRSHSNVKEKTSGMTEIPTEESAQYDFITIQAVTNCFSPDNKIGEGGYGAVYKAWKHWTEGKALDMVDQSLGGLYSRNEVIQCIHVGLLCVQEEVEDRPTMANVVLMLKCYSATRNTPKPPAFFNGLSQMISAGGKVDQSRSKPQPLSENEVSSSELYPR